MRVMLLKLAISKFTGYLWLSRLEVTKVYKPDRTEISAFHARWHEKDINPNSVKYYKLLLEGM